MSYKTKIYISGVTNLSDARYTAGMMVDYIGFCIEDNHTTSIGIEEFRAINGWIKGVEIIGEFYDKPIDEINKLVEEFNLNLVQIPGHRAKEIGLIDCEVIIMLESKTEGLTATKYRGLSSVLNSTQTEKGFVEVTSTSFEEMDLETVLGVCIKGGI